MAIGRVPARAGTPPRLRIRLSPITQVVHHPAWSVSKSSATRSALQAAVRTVVSHSYAAVTADVTKPPSLHDAAPSCDGATSRRRKVSRPRYIVSIAHRKYSGVLREQGWAGGDSKATPGQG